VVSKMMQHQEVSGLRIERSKSNSGKHVLNSTLYVYKKDRGLQPYTRFVVSEEPARPIYAKGEAKQVKVSIDHGDFLVHVWFVRNFKNNVKGYISILNHRGELLYRAKYLNGFVSKSKGSPIYAWLVRLFFEATKIPVKAMKLGDEK